MCSVNMQQRQGSQGTQNRVEIRCSYYHTRSSSSFHYSENFTIDCIDYVTGIGNAHAHNGVATLRSVLRLG